MDEETNKSWDASQRVFLPCCRLFFVRKSPQTANCPACAAVNELRDRLECSAGWSAGNGGGGWGRRNFAPICCLSHGVPRIFGGFLTRMSIACLPMTLDDRRTLARFVATLPTAFFWFRWFCLCTRPSSHSISSTASMRRPRPRHTSLMKRPATTTSMATIVAGQGLPQSDAEAEKVFGEHQHRVVGCRR